MAKLLQRIGAKEVKYDLEVEIHYVKLVLSEATLIKVNVKRGNDKLEETQAMQYNPKTPRVQFDYPLNFRITMYRKGKKFLPKDLMIKVLEVKSKVDFPIGDLKVKFHQLAETDTQILGKEFPLEHSSDPQAKICMSIKLTEEGKVRNRFLTGNVNLPDFSNSRRAVSICAEDFDITEFMDEKKDSTSLLVSSDWPEEADPVEMVRSNTIDGRNKPGPALKEIRRGSKDVTEEGSPRADRERKASIKTVRSAFCIPQSVLEELADEIEVEKSRDPELDAEELEGRNQSGDSESAQKVKTMDSTAVLEINEESKNKTLGVGNPYENKPSIALEKKGGLEVYREESKIESETGKKAEGGESGPVPEYLKYADEPVVTVDASSDQGEDSSSSDEMPLQVDITDEPEPQLPITNLKQSVPNSSSQELLLNLKEKESGLPDSREASCCNACQIQ